MANEGVPLGGQFPARNEMGPLSPYVQDVRAIGANRGYAKFDALSQGFTENQYYDPQTEKSMMNDENRDPSAPVVITDIPTSSTNYSRPSTVAAGYDPDTLTMTVVFRDGTFYNYYDVKPGEWENFSASYSKGKPWLNRGFTNCMQKTDGLFIGKPRGVADVDSLPADIQEQLYRVSRAQQLYRKPKADRRNPELVAKSYRKSNPKSGNPADRRRKK